MTLIERVKRRLKNVPAIYDLNAALKSAALSRAVRRVDRSYAGIEIANIDTSIGAVKKLIAKRVTEAGIQVRTQRAGDLRIFCVGTYYEQENGGFLQALGRLGEVVIFQNDRGGYGLRGAVSGHDPDIRSGNAACLIDQVKRAHAERPINVLIGTMVAQNTPLEALQYVRSLGIPVVNIAMDDRLPVHWQRLAEFRYGAIGLAPATDLVLQTTPEYVRRYLSDKCPAIFWPFGSDPALFHPAAQKDIDVVFVGNNYGWRHDLIAAIMKAGVKVEAFGSGFPNGHIDAAQVAEVFGRARIILGYGYVAYSRCVTTLKLRDLDGPMAGALYLTSHNPDLALLYEIGKEIETYGSIGECVDKIVHYLANDEERERIATAGRTRALRDHTWDARLRHAFEILGVLAPDSRETR